MTGLPNNQSGTGIQPLIVLRSTVLETINQILKMVPNSLVLQTLRQLIRLCTPLAHSDPPTPPCAVVPRHRRTPRAQIQGVTVRCAIQYALSPLTFPATEVLVPVTWTKFSDLSEVLLLYCTIVATSTASLF